MSHRCAGSSESAGREPPWSHQNCWNSAWRYNSCLNMQRTPHQRLLQWYFLAYCCWSFFLFLFLTETTTFLLHSLLFVSRVSGIKHALLKQNMVISSNPVNLHKWEVIIVLLLNILRGENCERGWGGEVGECVKWSGKVWLLNGYIRVLIGMTIGICIWLIFLSGEESGILNFFFCCFFLHFLRFVGWHCKKLICHNFFF